MKFKAVPPSSFEDITVDFEQAQIFLSNGDISVDSTGRLAVVNKVLGGETPLAVDGSGNSLALQLLSSQQLALTGGSAGLVFPTSQTATTKTVTHSIGRVPKIIIVTLGNGAVGANVTVSAGAAGTSTFTIDGFSSIALNATVNCFWAAIG